MPKIQEATSSFDIFYFLPKTHANRKNCVYILHPDSLPSNSKIGKLVLNSSNCWRTNVAYFYQRIEEQRARQAWEYHARRQEVVRQEELARMRAEERCTRALLYLEIEESNRMDIARREAREAASMVSEDLAMRELKRLHKKQMSDRRAMEAEDRLSKMRAHEER